MKTDLYTKTLLTIIAICLSVIVVNQSGIIPGAYAETRKEFEGNVNYGLVPLNDDGSINVRISSSEILAVKIEEVDVFAFNNCTVPVKIKN